MGRPRYPSLYQINTRVWLGELSRRLGRPATFDDVPDEFLDRVAILGFDILWPLGVWQTGEYGREASRTSPDWRRECAAQLPDLTDDDLVSSPFAITAYTAATEYGGDEALARFRERLRRRGLRLLLDFVPNHTAIDHPWVWQHPEYYLICDDADLAREPHNYCRVQTRLGPRVLAYGRDPYYPGWPDTVQLNYRSHALRQAMAGELLRVADRCDGVRCDMAMLLLPEVIQRIWGRKSLPADGTPPIDAPFWPEAIPPVRAAHPEFLFMAEVYWDLEWALQQQGFDCTYDKRLYDRLLARDAAAVRGQLHADPEFQRKSVRFLENHDEPRAAAAFPPDVHAAAAVVTFLVPGLRFFHEGQLEGRRGRVSMHLSRRPDEPVDTALQQFYADLLECLKRPTVRDGSWRLLDCRPAWPGNAACDRFIAFAWDGPGGERLLVAVNYGPTRGQCYVAVPWPDLAGRRFRLRDRLGKASYDRDGDDLARLGLYLDVPPWHPHVFEVTLLV
ncbi:MAG TPA: alpha-amylase family glycosyl hydrolase [Gemmataceae bacterium]|nr:alpha-amylase family glycosyl hydrolase [Gemmataceae bacterium]